MGENRSMRISFFVPRCMPDNSHGRYVIELAKRLRREHEIVVHAGAFWSPLRSVVSCRFLPVPNRPAIARLAALWTSSVISSKRRHTDIVHIQGADAPIGNVVTAHCCNAAMQASVDGKGSLTRRLNYAIGIAVERYCFTKPSTRVVIAVSHKVKADIQRHYGVDAKRIVVVPHGVDGEVFHPQHGVTSRAQVRAHLGLGRDDFVALFVGGDYRLKGLVPLLKAAGQVPNVKILAVGVTPDSALKWFVHQNGFQSTATFVGNSTDMPSLYGAADCFALPTRYDTFSLATLEAMATGLPVIVSREAGVAELLNPEYDSLVLADPDDVDAVAQNLRRLAQSKTLRASLGAEARRTAERHSWDEVVERTLEVYRQSLANSP
jgi:glycosyltransferase involved in cell wall biosynthesis